MYSYWYFISIVPQLHPVHLQELPPEFLREFQQENQLWSQLLYQLANRLCRLLESQLDHLHRSQPPCLLLIPRLILLPIQLLTRQLTRLPAQLRAHHRVQRSVQQTSQLVLAPRRRNLSRLSQLRKDLLLARQVDRQYVQHLPVHQPLQSQPLRL